MISINNLNIKYKGANNKTINDLSFSIQDNSVLIITGESGVGKTTIIKALLGFLPSNTKISGILEYDGVTYDLSKEKPLLLIKDSFYLPQHALNSLSQIHTISSLCLDFLKSRNLFTNKETAQTKFKAILKEMKIKRDIWNAYPFQLSGGELQRVLFAIAILIEAKIIFLDEPTSALDYENQKTIINILNILNSKYKKTLIIVTHSEKIIAQFKKNQLLITKEGDLNE